MHGTKSISQFVPLILLTVSVEIDIQIVFLILERFSPPTACGPAMYMILNDPEPGSDSVLDI